LSRRCTRRIKRKKREKKNRKARRGRSKERKEKEEQPVLLGKKKKRRERKMTHAEKEGRNAVNKSKTARGIFVKSQNSPN
jgi:hypothetical protein